MSSSLECCQTLLVRSFPRLTFPSFSLSRSIAHPAPGLEEIDASGNKLMEIPKALEQDIMKSPNAIEFLTVWDALYPPLVLMLNRPSRSLKTSLTFSLTACSCSVRLWRRRMDLVSTYFLHLWLLTTTLSFSPVCTDRLISCSQFKDFGRTQQPFEVYESKNLGSLSAGYERRQRLRWCIVDHDLCMAWMVFYFFFLLYWFEQKHSTFATTKYLFSRTLCIDYTRWRYQSRLLFYYCFGLVLCTVSISHGVGFDDVWKWYSIPASDHRKVEREGFSYV